MRLNSTYITEAIRTLLKTISLINKLIASIIESSNTLLLNGKISSRQVKMRIPEFTQVSLRYLRFLKRLLAIFSSMKSTVLSIKPTVRLLLAFIRPRQAVVSLPPANSTAIPANRSNGLCEIAALAAIPLEPRVLLNTKRIRASPKFSDKHWASAR